MIQFQEFFDKATFTLTYVVWDSNTLDAVIFDPVLDYDPAASRVSTESFDKLSAFLKSKPFNLHFIFETHAHADHLSSSQLIKKAFPSAQLAINERICEVQKVFKDVFDLSDFNPNGKQFDRLLKDGEIVKAGSLSFKVIFTPGHTPACTSFLLDNWLFTGDALFMPDYGVGRCDFPKGSADELFTSVTERLYSLPDSTQVFTGHDYQPNGRELRFHSTIGEEKASNIHINENTTRESFVKFRTERDKTLSAPKLLLPSIQINIDAGHFPKAHSNGKHYLSIPISFREKAS